LKETDEGFDDLGRTIQLYKLEDLEKKYIKEIGRTRTNNYDCKGLPLLLLKKVKKLLSNILIPSYNFINYLEKSLKYSKFFLFF